MKWRGIFPKAHDRLWRKLFPTHYVRIKLRQAENIRRKRLQKASGMSQVERYNLWNELEQDVWIWREWLQEIEDRELIAEARKMDIYLDEFPIHSAVDGMDKTHFVVGEFGNELLNDHTRTAMVQKKRERMPAYRKEQREVFEMYIKAGTVIVGMLGAATGMFAVLR